MRGALAVVVCWSLCFSSPIGIAEQNGATGNARPPQNLRQEYKPGRLSGDERILRALDRFTFGPKLGDLEAVRQMGLENWFTQQLHPTDIDNTDLAARLAQFPAMRWSVQDLLYRLPNNAMIRMAMNGKAAIPPDGALHAVYENQIYRFRLKKAAQEEKNEAAVANPNTPQPNTPQSSGMNAGISAEANSNVAPITRSREATTASRSGVMNTITAAPAVDQPSVDQAEVATILALRPSKRVERLQEMQPEEFENFVKSLKPVQRQALTAGMDPELKESVEGLEHPEQTVVQELLAQRLTRDIYSNAQLQEVMTDFWLNHFNVYLRKNEQMPYYLVSYERDVIRPHALGKFEDLLEAVAHSPAMLLYLDNAESIGPDSLAAKRAETANVRQPEAKRQAPEGLNENYARELMELHTLGVNGGYTQADVIQVARVLTGWTVDRPQFGGGFLFNSNRHEPGTKKVMRAKIKENGEIEGRDLLHFLAHRPATAQFISRKLAVRFVSDDPPQAIVNRMTKTYISSGGDIPGVLKTMFHSPEFWAASDYGAKVKTPLEFVVSAARASNATIENFQSLVNALQQMGMPLYGCVPPVGYKWDTSDWVSTGALVDRMNFALSLAANRLPGITVEWAPDLDMSSLDSDKPSRQVIPTPESEESRLEPMLVPRGVSEATRSAALGQFKAQSAQKSARAKPVAELRRPNRAPAVDTYEREDQVLAGLLMGSPEFQRR